jgi:hypothetical protein
VTGFYSRILSSTLQETAAVATIITRRKQEKNSLKGRRGEKQIRKNNHLSSQTQISTTKTSAVGALLSYENPSPQHEI